MFRFLKFVVRSLLRISFRFEFIGLDNIPAEGPVVIVTNHSAVIDSYIFPAFLSRKVVLLSKHEHLKERGLLGVVARVMVKNGAVTVDRSSSVSRGRAALELVRHIKEYDEVVELAPEGTRTPSGKVYRGEGGFLAIAKRAHAVIVPVVFIGTEIANPPGKLIPRFGTRITVVIGRPIEPFISDRLDRFASGSSPVAKAVHAFREGLKKFRSEATLETESEYKVRKVMERIAALGGLEYVDEPPPVKKPKKRRRKRLKKH